MRNNKKIFLAICLLFCLLTLQVKAVEATESRKKSAASVATLGDCSIYVNSQVEAETAQASVSTGKSSSTKLSVAYYTIQPTTLEVFVAEEVAVGGQWGCSVQLQPLKGWRSLGINTAYFAEYSMQVWSMKTWTHR